MKKRENKQQQLSIEELEKEKQKILNYRQSHDQKEKPPEAWFRIRERNEYSKKYTAEAYAPIKEWYNQTIYQIEIKKFNNTIENSKVKPLNLITDLQQKDLKRVLIKIFEQYKIITETSQSSKNIEHNQYFINFFDTFMPKLSLCCILLKNSFDYLELYHQVFNLETFKQYLKRTPGLYSQMALWSMENPYPFPSNSEICNSHHIMPKFLYQKPNYGFSKPEIEKNYNRVDIGWLIHILFHLVRLLEYNQQEDYRALAAVVALGSTIRGGKNFITFYDLSNPVLSFSQVLTQVLKNYPKLNTSQSNLAPDVVKILTKNTKWRHSQAFINQDGSITSFEFLHTAQTPDQTGYAVSLNGLIDKLIETEGKRIKITNSFSKIPIHKPKQIAERIARYLRGAPPDKGRKPLMVVYDYYLINAEPPIPQWSELLPYSSFVGQKVTPTTIFEARFIVKHKNPIVPDIVGLPGDFTTIKDLVNLCVKKQHQFLGLELSSKNYYKLKDYFQYRIEMHYGENEQHQFRLDWHLTRLPLV